MEKEIPLYIMIYNKIVNRILIGLYPKGYQLDSVQKIHKDHGIGYTSIRRALRMLQQDGFISAQERKRPVVVFDAEDPQGRELRERIFLSRCESHIECCRAMPCVIPGLVAAGAQKSDKCLLDALDTLCSQSPDAFTCRRDLLVFVYTWQAMVIQKADNDLASDLFLQIRGFDDLLFMVLPGEQLLQEEVIATIRRLKYWTELIRRGQLQDLYTLVSICCQQILCDFHHMISPFCKIAAKERIREVDFRWYVRQAPEPLYKKIAFDLLRLAQRDNLRQGACFPSEQILADQYGVSVVTIHSAFTMLNSLGVTQTVNGAGTFLTGEGSCTQETRQYIQEYYESLRILAYCSRAIAFEAASKLNPEQVQQIKQELQRSNCTIGVLLCLLRHFIQAADIAPLQNIYEQLEVRTVFGMYVSEIGTRPSEETLQHCIQQVVNGFALLKPGHEEEFAMEIGQICLSACAQQMEELEHCLQEGSAK